LGAIVDSSVAANGSRARYAEPSPVLVLVLVTVEVPAVNAESAQFRRDFQRRDPTVGRRGSSGSRLPLAYARETGANFVTAGALEAARARTAVSERHQSFDHQRLWADLLSSAAMCFNLFGELASDPALADRAVRVWWPEAPGTVCDVRFAHSPGRFDPAYLNSLRAFDAAFVLDIGDGTQGIVGVDTQVPRTDQTRDPQTERPLASSPAR
jgi:hypothetical protein